MARCDEQLDVLRRIAERGLDGARWDNTTDIWQHLLDEIERTKIEYNKEREDKE